MLIVIVQLNVFLSILLYLIYLPIIEFEVSLFLVIYFFHS